MDKDVAILQTDLIRNNGAELVSMMQARELGADLWCSKYDDDVFPRIAGEIDIYEYGGALPLDFPFSTTWNTVSPAFKSPSFLSDYDAVICHKDLGEILALRAKNRYDVDFIWYMHNTSDLLYRNQNLPVPIRMISGALGIYLRALDRKAFEGADAIFSNSELTIQDVVVGDFGDSTKVEPLYPPVRELEASTNQRDYALVLSRVAHGKNIEIAIDEMRTRDEKLKIAGSIEDEEYREELEVEADNREVDIEFLGFVPNDELAKVISEAKFGIFTQQNAHFGLVPLEMYMAGTPCFVPENTGAAEVLPKPLRLPIDGLTEPNKNLNLNKLHFNSLREALQ